ncbi:uncharacterized protein LOC144579471 [Callithrix jacchus]
MICTGTTAKGSKRPGLRKRPPFACVGPRHLEGALERRTRRPRGCPQPRARPPPSPGCSFPARRELGRAGRVALQTPARRRGQCRGREDREAAAARAASVPCTGLAAAIPLVSASGASP